MHTDWPSTIGYKILLEVRFEVVHVYLAQHCFFFPLPHVPLEFKMLLPPVKKQKILTCIREIQVHKHWTKVYSQKVLTAMILNAILNVHGISDCLFGYRCLSVCFFFFMLLLGLASLGLKARVNKKGEFPSCGVDEVPPSIIYVGGNLSTWKIYFSLCVNVLFFSKNKWHIFNSSAFDWCVKPNSINFSNIELQNKQDWPTICQSFSYNPHYGFVAKRIARFPK